MHSAFAQRGTSAIQTFGGKGVLCGAHPGGPGSVPRVEFGYTGGDTVYRLHFTQGHTASTAAFRLTGGLSTA